MLKKLLLSFSLFLCLAFEQASAQREMVLSMEDAIYLGQLQSLEVTAAKNNFLSDFWSYRSYRASLLPSLSLSADIANFDRSLRALQNSETGEITYLENYNMNNTGSIFIRQYVAKTGGTFTLRSSLERLDQYSPNRRTTYYSQPVTLSYLQPIFTFNSFKWDRKIEPAKYERAKREYLEQLENVTIKSVKLFFELLLAEMNLRLAEENYQNTGAMFEIAEKRHDIGSIKKAALLQLELRMINDSISINNQRNNYQAKARELKSFLGLDMETRINIMVPDALPEIIIDGEKAVERAFSNSSFLIDQDVIQLESEREIARAKGSSGLSVQVNTQFGLSNSSPEFARAYADLLDKEILGISIQIPIMDWGMGKGRVKLNMAKHEATMNRIQQGIIDYKENIYIQVIKFNS